MMTQDEPPETIFERKHLMAKFGEGTVREIAGTRVILLLL
jgi:hypothetical protein